MPKSRGRKGGHRSPRPSRFAKPGQGQWGWTGLPPEDRPNLSEDEWAPTPRRAMVGVCVTKGRRFDVGSVQPMGPPGEAWTNAWYTVKENKDKGWRYCEGICKHTKDDGTTGLITSAWVIDSYGHVLECTPGIDADWYQGFVLNTDADMMNPPGLVWDEGLPRPTVAASDADLLDGQRQLEAVSRTTGDGWLGSMLETGIGALHDAYGVKFGRAAFATVDNIVDWEATDRYGSTAPNLLDNPKEFEEVSEVYPTRNAESEFNRKPK